MTSQHDHESNSLSGSSGGPSVPMPLAIAADKPSANGPTLGTRLIIFSALVLPSALIPLLVLRRSVNNLHRKIDELSGATRGLHHEYKSVMLELSDRRTQHEQLQAMISKARDDHTHLRRETYRLRKSRARKDERMRGQVQELRASNQYVNEAQVSRLRELGTSLADVAAFMQEIELQQGLFTPRFDARGIERLRFLAMQFEGMGKVKTAHTDVSSSLRPT
ncbi:hypothetical protein BJV77DRAFT_940738 [Russula vinacea]|nr:hypothetical protein BJV77DRAFT_940738 [Russula vinacea]